MTLIWHHNTWPWGKTARVITADASGIVEMTFEDCNPGVCFISGLSVVPSMRRNGIATHLMLRCESYCRENGIFRLDLNSVMEDWVLDFYKKLGYTAIKEEGGFIQMFKLLK
jgi:ribosomal protein S18 acetylase RimI-like enzyme